MGTKMLILRSVFATILFGAANLQGAIAAPEPRKSFDERLQELSTIPSVLTHRDPFVKASSPFMPPPSVSQPVVAAPADDAIDPNDPDLLRYPASQYKIMAILLGDVYPRALIKTPDNKVFVVRENDRLGKRRGYIRRVQEGAIIVVEEFQSGNGLKERTELRLALTKGEGK
jgi:Tfp pilus assembly protein PilP